VSYSKTAENQHTQLLFNLAKPIYTLYPIFSFTMGIRRVIFRDLTSLGLFQRLRLLRAVDHLSLSWARHSIFFCNHIVSHHLPCFAARCLWSSSSALPLESSKQSFSCVTSHSSVMIFGVLALFLHVAVSLVSSLADDISRSIILTEVPPPPRPEPCLVGLRATFARKDSLLILPEPNI